jgi:C1A family cysteine protease
MLHRLSAAALAALLLPACLTSPESDLDTDGFVDGDKVEADPLAPPLSTLEEIFPEGRAEIAPGPVSKAIARKFDLVAMQTPVKNQASRGVCSIFASAALVEHLYKKAGIPNLDVSEQYLQWSTKVQLGRFTSTEGSNNAYNLQAVNRFGVPTESAWAYETTPWNASHDPACGEDSKPVQCYTNGAPPASASADSTYKLKVASSSEISSHQDTIKNHIERNQTAVAIGIRFYYQAWNHRVSNLVINPARFRQGIVTYPNAEDFADATGDREAGHAVLLVGWDDDFSVQKVDKDGNLKVLPDGTPDMETGFFIFKNSWGTSNFGVENPYGAGYGYLSYRYVREKADARVINTLPTIQAERCDLATGDEDLDGLANCDDSACATAAVCATGPEPTDVLTFSATPNASIPDNNLAGASSTITISDAATIGSLSVSLDIAHSWIGDLKVTLSNGSTTITLHNNTDRDTDNIIKTVTVADFNGQNLAGTWTLTVVDSASSDVGTIRSWSLAATPR